MAVMAIIRLQIFATQRQHPVPPQSEGDNSCRPDRRAYFFGNIERGQQGPFLVARGARATLHAGERDEHLVLAVGQRTRANPSCRSPHLRKAATDRWTIGRQKPYLA